MPAKKRATRHHVQASFSDDLYDALCEEAAEQDTTFGGFLKGLFVGWLQAKKEKAEKAELTKQKGANG